MAAPSGVPALVMTEPAGAPDAVAVSVPSVLDAERVVSEAQTGPVPPAEGEGVSGLAVAGLAAGVVAVVGTGLWWLSRRRARR